MCSTIINLSERGLETLDYSYETATAIILDKNDIRDINTISFMTNVQQTLLLHCNRIASLKRAEEFLPHSLCILSLAENDIPTLTESLVHCGSLLQLSIRGNLCAFNQIPHSRSYILALLPTLNFIDGNQPLQDERLLGEWIAKSGAVQRYNAEDEFTLIDFLRGLKLELPHQADPRFCRQSDATRRVGCSRGAVFKRSFTATNGTTLPTPRSSTPPRWLQRARSAQNITLTAAVAASTCMADSIHSSRNPKPSLQCQPQLSAASCNAIPTLTNPCAPHILHSDSIFVPIDSAVGLGEAEAEVTVQSPKNVSQTVSVDLPADSRLHSEFGPTRCENMPVLTDTQGTHYSPQFLRSLTALSQKLESASSFNEETEGVAPKVRKPSPVSDVQMKGGSSMLLNHRLLFSRGALASLLHHRPCITEGPAINMMSEKADHRSNGGASETCSPLSEHTFVVDPPFESARSPEGLEARILALRRQLEELRVLSANQERERLRQAGAIRRLAEEVRSLKAWKASVLQRQDAHHPAAGDSIHHKFQSVADPDSAPQRVWSVHTSSVSPSLSTLVAINTSSTTNATANVGASTVCDVEGQESEEDEGEEESPTDDSDDVGDEVEDFPEPRASSLDMNGTLLTANISTDSLDTHRSRTSTPMGFGTSSTYLGNNCQLASESILLPTDANSST
ncbi:centrosomal protein of 97 kda [Echinococcus multilocularis]|uniref:Centrosomal protein of 97 kDa n=1 Tax=Echinococcus multilocularis TaxID=6211 RepID=A0A087VZJ9_ECHMU|nr:centrosomal protein of 97 kda [Echinococcus multilocularis]